MSTWEERMSQRAHARMAADETMRRELDEAAYTAEREARERAALHGDDIGDLQFYVGTCACCGMRCTLIHSPSQDGIIDVGIEEHADGGYSAYTWVTHLGGPLAACEIYSSRVYQVSREEYRAS